MTNMTKMLSIVDITSLVRTKSRDLWLLSAHVNSCVCVDVVAGLQQLTSSLARGLNGHRVRRQRLATNGETCSEDEVWRGNPPLSPRCGTPYLVADIVGAVRVSSASTSLPQLRHVWLVSPPDVTVSHKPTPEHGGREKEDRTPVDSFQSGETAGLFLKLNGQLAQVRFPSVGRWYQRAATELSLTACVCVSLQSPPICFVTVRKITTHHFRRSFKIKGLKKQPKKTLVRLVCEYTFYSTDVNKQF